MISEEYLMGIRIGSAIAGYKILERIIKDKFKEEYKINKYKLRYLSAVETEELLMEAISAKDIDVIKKYIR